MGKFSELQIKITAAISDAQKSFRTLNADLAKMSNDASKSTIGFQKLGSTLTAIGVSGSAVSLGIVGIGGSALKAAAGMEQAQVAMTTMLKSSTLARAEMEKLKQFAASTPFQFPELVDAQRRMLALGFAAKDTIPTLTTVGNAASALGIGAEGMQRIILALGQMKAKGTVQAEEMRQLAEAGIPAWQSLADKIGVTVPEAMKLVEQRSVAAATGIAAVMEAMDARFAGGMAAQAKTLAGVWANLKDQMNFALADIGNALAPTAKAFLSDFVKPVLAGLAELSRGFAALPPTAMIAANAIAAVAFVGPLATIAIGTVLSNLMAIKTAITGLGLAMGTLGLAVKAVGWASIVAGIYAVTASLGEYYYKLNSSADVSKRFGLSQRDVVALASHANTSVAKATGTLSVSSRSALDAVVNFTRGMKSSSEASRDAASEINSSVTTVLGGTKDALRQFGEEVDGLEQHFRSLLDTLHDIETQRAAETQTDAWIALTTEVINFHDKTIEAAGSVKRLVEAADFSSVEEHARTAAEFVQDLVDETQAFAHAAGQIQFPNLPTEVPMVIKQRTEEMAESMKKAGEVFKTSASTQTKALQQVSLIVNDVSRDITKLIFDGGKFKDAMVKAARSIGEALVRNVLEAALKPILKSLTDILGKLPGLGSIFGGASGAASLPSYVQVLKPSTSAGGGAASAAASGLTGWIGLGASVATAVSSVVSNFQLARQENTLNAIEWNTRKSSLHLEHILTTGVNNFLSALPGIHDRLMEFRTAGMGVWPQPGYQWAGAGSGGGGVSVTVNGMVYGGSAGISQFADLLIAELRRRGLRF